MTLFPRFRATAAAVAGPRPVSILVAFAVLALCVAAFVPRAYSGRATSGCSRWFSLPSLQPIVSAHPLLAARSGARTAKPNAPSTRPDASSSRSSIAP